MKYKFLLALGLILSMDLETSFFRSRFESGIAKKNASNLFGFNKFVKPGYNYSSASLVAKYYPYYKSEDKDGNDSVLSNNAKLDQKNYLRTKFGIAGLGAASLAAAHYYQTMDNDAILSENEGSAVIAENVKDEIKKKLTQEELEELLYQNTYRLTKQLEDVHMIEIYKHKEEIIRTFNILKKAFEDSDESVRQSYPDLDHILLKVNIDKIIEDMKNFSFWNMTTVYNDFMDLKYLLIILPPKTKDLIFNYIGNPIIKSLMIRILS